MYLMHVIRLYLHQEAVLDVVSLFVCLLAALRAITRPTQLTKKIGVKASEETIRFCW